jgi:hypothetical protein
MHLILEVAHTLDVGTVGESVNDMLYCFFTDALLLFYYLILEVAHTLDISAVGESKNDAAIVV